MKTSLLTLIDKYDAMSTDAIMDHLKACGLTNCLHCMAGEIAIDLRIAQKESRGNESTMAV